MHFVLHRPFCCHYQPPVIISLSLGPSVNCFSCLWILLILFHHFIPWYFIVLVLSSCLTYDEYFDQNVVSFLTIWHVLFFGDQSFQKVTTRPRKLFKLFCCQPNCCNHVGNLSICPNPTGVVYLIGLWCIRASEIFHARPAFVLRVCVFYFAAFEKGPK